MMNQPNFSEDSIDKRKVAAKKLLDFVAKENPVITNLKHRWADEREYEDFEDYRKIIVKTLEEAGYTVKSVSQGFKIVAVTEGITIELKVGITKISVSIKP